MQRIAIFALTLVTSAAHADNTLCNCLLDRNTPAETRGDLALGVVVTENSKGVRLEIDVVARDGWTAGVALGLATSTWRFGDERMGATLVYDDAAAAISVAKTFVNGPWRLRLQAGAGLLQTDYAGTMATTFLPSQEVEGSTEMKRTYEAAVTLAYEVDNGLSLSAGPLLSYLDQTFTIGTDFMPQPVSRDYELGLWLAIKKHL